MATKSLSVSYRVINGVKYQRLIHIFSNYRELSYEKLSVSLDIRTPTYAFEISSAHLILKQGSEMKKQRESQCTQKTISLLSPLGTIQVSGCENGVHTIQILMDVAPAERTSEAPLSCVVNDSLAETSPELQRCVEWLQAYFSEPQTIGSLPLPAFHHPALQGDAFSSRVLQVLLRDVKFGETVSYKRLAEMVGNPRAVRAVGGAMRKNPVPLLIPCHRVISSSGQSGPYMSGKGNHLKQWLLTHERQ